jgi:hypothetical protein
MNLFLLRLPSFKPLINYYIVFNESDYNQESIKSSHIILVITNHTLIPATIVAPRPQKVSESLL